MADAMVSFLLSQQAAATPSDVMMRQRNARLANPGDGRSDLSPGATNPAVAAYRKALPPTPAQPATLWPHEPGPAFIARTLSARTEAALTQVKILEITAQLQRAEQSTANAQVAPGVNCQRDPQLGEVCGLYRDIYGLADAATNGRRSFSSGGWVVANEFAYSGRADSGSGLTYATGSGTGYATFGLLRAEASGVAGTGGEWLGPNAVGNGRTRVGFSDRINVQSTALNGQQGTVVAWLELSGERQVSSSAWGSSDAGVQVVTPSQTVLGQVFSNGGVTSASGNASPSWYRRNFYGTLEVVEPPSTESRERHRLLVHGATTHGLQLTDPARTRIPTSYYATTSGVGRAVASLGAGDGWLEPHAIGRVGLGVGTLATYARDGDSLRIYEINPAIRDLARDRFSYLDECPATVEVVTGAEEEAEVVTAEVATVVAKVSVWLCGRACGGARWRGVTLRVVGVGVYVWRMPARWWRCCRRCRDRRPN
jgi:hypothetical protein